MSVDSREFVKSLVEWCSDNGECDSVWSTPFPQHYVYTNELFDFLHKAFDIPKEQIGEWFNNRQEYNQDKVDKVVEG